MNTSDDKPPTNDPLGHTLAAWFMLVVSAAAMSFAWALLYSISPLKKSLFCN